MSCVLGYDVEDSHDAPAGSPRACARAAIARTRTRGRCRHHPQWQLLGRVVLREMCGDALSCGEMVAKAWSVITMKKIHSVALFADFTGGRLQRAGTMRSLAAPTQAGPSRGCTPQRSTAPPDLRRLSRRESRIHIRVACLHGRNPQGLLPAFRAAKQRPHGGAARLRRPGIQRWCEMMGGPALCFWRGQSWRGPPRMHGE